MQARFYKNFSKRTNSTKRPSSSDTYTTKNVVLKDNTSLMTPAFLLTGVDFEWSYVYWNSHYYFISDIVARNNNVYEVQCDMDVLASWRGTIGNYNTFIERSSSNYDSMINDELLSGTQEITNISRISFDIGLSSTGCYLIGVSSKTGARVYVFSTLEQASAFYNGTQFTAKDGNGATIVKDIDDFLTTGTMQAFNLPDYCTPIMWVPVPYSEIALPATGTVAIGFWELNLSGYRQAGSEGAYRGQISSLALPSNQYTDFRKNNPRFSVYKLWLPCVGEVELDALEVNQNDLAVDMYVDLFSGAITYKIHHGYSQSTDKTFATFNGQAGVQLPCGNSSFDLGSLITNTVGGVVSVASGNVGGAIGSGVAVASSILTPQTNISGGAGNRGMSKMQSNVVFTCTNYGSKSFPSDVAGRPYYTNNTISNLSGFVKCGNASIELPCSEQIRDRVNNYLNSGFYWE